MKPLMTLYVGMTLLACAATGSAQNSQAVHVRGVVVNQASGGGHAIMNMASTQNGAINNGRNRQQVDVTGAVVNSATSGARSELNVASKKQSSSGSQVISVTGPIVTGASGRGVTSTVNIGGQ